MGRSGTAESANPTIQDVLDQFLAEQRQRLSAKTYSSYNNVISLLKQSLDSYGDQTLDTADAKLFNQLYKAKGQAHREFCEIFGPEHILPNVDEFLGWFMVRKVMAGKGLLKAAGTVTRKLAKWLAANGYADEDDAKDAQERGSRAARELPKAEELAALLHDLAKWRGSGEFEQLVEDHFVLIRVEPGRIWLAAFTKGTITASIPVPEEISDQCTVGWMISGVIGRRSGGWRLVEVWNVYPR